MQFFTLPAAGVTAVDVPPAPTITLAPIPPIDPVAVDLSRITVPLPSPTTASSRTAGGAAGQAGTAAGTGGAGGSGTGDEDRYILPPNPRGVIVPPERAPRSVRGRKYRATFWVGADGRVDRVELSPRIEDAEYRAALIERLMDFAFYPARRAGIAIPGVVPIVFAIP